MANGSSDIGFNNVELFGNGRRVFSNQEIFVYKDLSNFCTSEVIIKVIVQFNQFLYFLLMLCVYRMKLLV